MKELIGSPGMVSGLLLRIGQFLCAAASIGVMVSAKGFSNYTAFCYLIASMGLQVLWSFGLACLDVYALRIKRDLQNPVLVSLFVVGDWVTATLSLAAACSSAGIAVLYAKDLDFCKISRLERVSLGGGLYSLSTFRFVSFSKLLADLAHIVKDYRADVDRQWRENSLHELTEAKESARVAMRRAIDPEDREKALASEVVILKKECQGAQDMVKVCEGELTRLRESVGSEKERVSSLESDVSRLRGERDGLKEEVINLKLEVDKAAEEATNAVGSGYQGCYGWYGFNWTHSGRLLRRFS